MKIKIKNENLRRCTSIASKSVARTSSPVTEKFKVTAYDGKIKVTAYNYTVSSVVTCDGAIEEEGGCLIDAAMLIALLNKASDKDVSIETSGSKIIVKCGRSKYELPFVAETEFPDMPIVNGDNAITIKGTEFVEAYKKVQPFMSPSKPTTNAMYINVVDNNVEFVACDGFHIGIATYLNNTGINKSFLINRDALKSIIPAVDEDSDVEIAFGRNNLKISSGNAEIICRQISEEYMDYERVYQQAVNNTKGVVKADVDTITRAIEQAVPVVENSQKNPLTLNITNDKIEISSFSVLGKMNTSCQVSGDMGEPLKIGVNASYMLDTLNMFKGEVNIKVSTPISPIIIENDKDRAFVLPMRIKQGA